MNDMQISRYLKPGNKAHLIGIGGVSMSPLAEVLKLSGLTVTGSDMKDSVTVRQLRERGITVMTAHDPVNIIGADFIIRTAAAHEDNPEIAEARKLGVPVFERADAWGAIMRGYETAVCVSGTHGKTTATSMVAHILLADGADPSVMLGGTLPVLSANYRIGKGNTILLESDEYYNSFHRFFPTIAVILNIEMDHPDFFSGIDEIKASFRKFASLIPETGHIVVNNDDKNAVDAVAGLPGKLITFGLDHNSMLYAVNIKQSRRIEFDLFYNGSLLEHITLNQPGIHNVYNALAAAGASLAAGANSKSIREGLSEFAGAKRRLEYKGNFNGAEIYDDYAHHPTELRALLNAVSTMGFDRVICAFQPHTYSRTKALFYDFADELKRADLTLLAEIFAAREVNAYGISSETLAKAVPGAMFCPNFDVMFEKLRQIAQKGDIVLTVGAGDIYQVGEKLVAI